MNMYKQLRDKQEQEFCDAGLTRYAYGKEQFADMMSKWGMDADDPEDVKKLTQVAPGAFILKADKEKYIALIKHLDQELAEAIAADPTGENFVRQMFVFELINHEYTYTRDVDDTLESLGLTAEDVENDPRLKHGLELAVAEVTKGEN